MQVCWAEKLHRETFYLAVDYVDRYGRERRSTVDELIDCRVMAKGPSLGIFVQIGKYQLLGTTALFIAAKFEVGNSIKTNFIAATLVFHLRVIY